jgi:trk system potassium uptake protein TrkA
MLKYAVIGLGRFGSTLARQLAEFGAEVVAIDVDEARVDAVRDHVSVALCMDCSDVRVLEEQGIGTVDVAVVGIGERFEAAQLATVHLKRLGVKRVVVKAPTELRRQILERIGADEVVNPEKASALRLAQKLISPRIHDYFELAQGHSLVEITPPQKFHGRTIREIDVRKEYGVNIVAVKKRREVGRDDAGAPIYEEKLLDIPRPTDVIDPTDILVVIGEDADISRLAN